MMAKLNTIPTQTRQIEQIGTVDLVIGLVDQKGSENLTTIAAAIRKGLERLSGPTRTALVLRDAGATAVDSGSEGGLEDESLQLLSYSLPAPDSSFTLLQSISSAYRSLGEISQRLGARACAVAASTPENLTSEWIYGLAQPILERDFDLVTPCYESHKFEGLLNGAILSPLTRALYGKQIQNPLGPDLGFSPRLFERVLQSDPTRARGGGMHQYPLIGTEAIVGGLKVCQAHLGRRIYPPVDWKNLDSVLAEVLDLLFFGIERDAPFWQHIRSSEPVPTFGDPVPLADESVAADVRRLLEPFKLGVRNLQEIWALVLPPAALFELKKVDRLPPEEFRIPDELWARIVYDFALAYRLRTIARDHLLRALTPLYLGWIASYAVEVESAGRSAVQRRWERLCGAYESGKPYFVSRWRWPDRFNP
jgi:glucosylglycerate synthase